MDDFFIDTTDGGIRESCYASSSSSMSDELYMIGFVFANIVGIQHYSGTISGRELVGLVREPLNPYDENAIKVLNTRMSQVGHVERSVAAVLSPMIDSNIISVEGIVPAKPGKGFRFKIQSQIHVFARIVAFPTVISAIKDGCLNLVSISDAPIALSEAAIVKEKRQQNRSVEEIFKLVDENVWKDGSREPLEPPKSIIKSDLFLHQKEAIGWLYHRENSSELPPFWEEKGGMYVNALTNYETSSRPEPIRGGILADDMGLGKTLTVLSLIALDKSDDPPPPLPTGSSKRKRRWRDCRSSTKKTTLIVCPSSVMSTWIAELAEHTEAGSLKVYMYYGHRTEEEDELQKYDVVLTTYSTLGSEFHCETAPAKKVEWHRIILDEAHVIKNPSAVQSQAVSRLKGYRRWAVTGTPIQNGTHDLFSLMAFLRFEPFSEKAYWESLINRHLGNQTGLSRLQVLMATIALRRTKERSLNLLLPAKTLETLSVELSGEERCRYDRMETDGKLFLRQCISSGNVTGNYATVLTVILRLRQICTHVDLCPPETADMLGDISENPDLLKKAVAALHEGEDLDCPICISPPPSIVITRCAHIFCESCILKSLKRLNPCCPICRNPLSESDLFSAPLPESSDAGTVSSSPSCNPARSSKVRTLLKLLTDQRDGDPTVKSVVFSQFRKMLTLLEAPLAAAGLKVLRLDGTMTVKKRTAVLKSFQVPAPEGATVLLASLKATSVGVNLTAASRIFLLEPWWNPAVEEQAMDRVHRIGQTKEVRIVRLVAKDTIEERILKLQEQKKKLAREAFGARPRHGRRDVAAGDIRLLMAV